MSENPEAVAMPGTQAPVNSPRRRAGFVAVAVLVAASGLLAWWLFANEDGEIPAQVVRERGSPMLSGAEGSPGAVNPPMAAAGAAAPQLPGLDVMATKLAKKLEQDPGDGEGWGLLARTYLELGDMAKADAAHARAVELRPQDQAMKAEYAEAKKALQSPHP